MAVIGIGLVIASTIVLAVSSRRGRSGFFDGGIGRELPRVPLKTLSGGIASWDDQRGPNGLVLVFLGTQCPLSNQYVPLLNKLAESGAKGGVPIVGVFTNASDTAESVAEHVREAAIRFPVLLDERNAAAIAWKVSRTNEALLVDRHGTLRYRGAIDDALRPGISRDQRVHPFLETARSDVLAGRRVDISMTPVFGCPIEWSQAPNDPPPPPRVRPLLGGADRRST